MTKVFINLFFPLLIMNCTTTKMQDLQTVASVDLKNIQVMLNYKFSSSGFSKVNTGLLTWQQIADIQW